MLKKLVFLGTGGTIAGKAASASDNVGYTAAQVGVADLLNAVPALPAALAGHAFEAEQVAQLDSKDMGWPQWAALAQRVTHHLGQPDVAAVLVTHGTDTLEETAFFLSQIVPVALLAAKPVVMTCAMRPATSMAPDGPQNILDAVAVAQARAARGVLVVCAGAIHSARDVQKVHPYRVNAFDSGEAGPLGLVEEARVRWLHACPVVLQAVPGMAVDQLPTDAWPRVEIVMNHVGASGAMVRALCANPPEGVQPVRGLVVAGTGNGTLQHDLEAALRQARVQGIVVVRTSRCAFGSLVGKAGADALPTSEGLSTLKARIAMLLSLLAQKT